jgi:group I intron endonuclease
VYYVGSSKDIHRRWKEHVRELNKGIHHSPHLQRAWDKYGRSDFVFEIVEIVSEKNLLLLVEQRYLDIAKTESVCYNVSFVAIGGCDETIRTKLINRWTPEMKNKRALDLTADKNPFYHKKHTEDTKILISQLHTGRVQSKEHVKSRLKYGKNNPSTDTTVYVFENKKTNEKFEGMSLDFANAYPHLAKLCRHWVRTGGISRSGWFARAITKGQRKSDAQQ